MKNVVVGVLAHVDAGKTTLSEAILYETGARKVLGRVDKKDTLLDYDEYERSRGITVFSKQAQFYTSTCHITWLDTPGHVDFSAEMERTLQVLDYAVLVISASDGITGHTKTLWKLLAQYRIPVFCFINKMDRPDCHADKIMQLLRKQLSDGCVCFSDGEKDTYGEYGEELCVLTQKEDVLEQYLETGVVGESVIAEAVAKRLIFPCFFGSALKNKGVRALLRGFDRFIKEKRYSDSFGARIYKITRDGDGNRLTHMKITGGSLSVRDLVADDEKINQIRIYSGEDYSAVQSVFPGQICAVTGPRETYAGQGLGIDTDNPMQLTAPVLTYRMLLPDNISARQIYPHMKQLAEEMPDWKLDWNEQTETVCVSLMGQMQTEILKELVKRRLSFEPDFDMGSIAYMETIADTVIGVGHFEPLRHYAETHIRIEPAPRGSGISVASECSVDVLDKNWQRLILTHLLEKSHIGVLTGAKLTDVKITLINGRAHQKHTEGGDFRQATYRAVRQGLMQAESILLEPYYDFVLDIPADLIGRAMTDIDALYGKVISPQIEGERATLTGYGPVSTLRDYRKSLDAYTHGTGSMYVSLRGYDVCHNTDEVVAQAGYDPDADVRNPSSSVFCAHGAGFLVSWYDVPNYMHVSDEAVSETVYLSDGAPRGNSFDYSIDLEEIDAILSKTYQANRRDSKHEFKKKKPPVQSYPQVRTKPERKKLLIVDGYNVIFAWEELNAIAKANIDGAKDRLQHILSNYQGICGKEILLVFDGYRKKGNTGSVVSTEQITVVHTKEDVTADQWIEKYSHENAENYAITVATSDGMIQQIVRGANGRIISSKELLLNIEAAAKELRETYGIDTI